MSDELDFENKVSIAGEFDIYTRKCDADGNPIGEPVLRHSGKNLITNIGMDLLGSDSLNIFCGAIQVGTGTTAPAYTDTALVSRVAGVSLAGIEAANWSWHATNTKMAVLTRSATFAVGAATGVLGEIALAQTVTGTVNTRARFLDGSGNPTTVTVLSDEQLIVTYHLFFTAGEADSVLVTTQKGTEYTLTLRPSKLGVQFASGISVGYGSWRLGYGSGYSNVLDQYATARSGAIGSVTSAAAGSNVTSLDGSAWEYAPYVAGSHYRDSVFTATPSQFNGANMASIQIGTGLPFQSQIGISPPLTKTSSDRLTLRLRTTWTRA